MKKKSGFFSRNVFSGGNMDFIIPALVIFFASFLYMFLMMGRFIDVYDEGIVLTGAMRVAAGEIIHRDFYANYGPAEFYLLSWLFEVFGLHVSVERAFDLCVRSGIVSLIYVATAYYSMRWIAMVAAATCAVWLGLVGNYGYPIYPTLLFAVGSALLMVQVLARNAANGRQFLAGFLVGLAALFRYDIGFLAFLSQLTSVALILLVFGRNNVRPVAWCFYSKLNMYVVGAFLPVGLVVFLYYINGFFSDFLHDIVFWPMKNYAYMRGLPFPTLGDLFLRHDFFLGLADLAIYLPVMVLSMVFIFFFMGFWRSISVSMRGSVYEKDIDSVVVFLISFSILVFFFYLKGVVRVTLVHMQLSIIPAVMVLAVVFGVVKNEKSVFKQMLNALAVFVVLSAVTAGSIAQRSPGARVLDDEATFDIIRNPDWLVNDVAASDVYGNYGDKIMFLLEDDREAAVQYLLTNTAPDQRIFVGLTRHDKIVQNDVSAYFLARRLPATKWHHFDPGLQTVAEIQSEMVFDLEKSKPDYIWLESTWNYINEPNGSAVSSGVDILDKYIASHYQEVKSFGEISILRRKTSIE